MVLIDSTARLIALQFRFANEDAIPLAVRNLSRKASGRKVTSSAGGEGIMFVQPTKNCSLVKFLDDLTTAGYEMVYAFTEERGGSNGIYHDPNRGYYIVRFAFVRSEYVEQSMASESEDDQIVMDHDLRMLALEEICKNAMWRVRAYSNPLFKDGKAVPGERAMSINFEERAPFFGADGKPVMVWQRDEWKNKVGDAALPVKPAYHLRIEENTIRPVAA